MTLPVKEVLIEDGVVVGKSLSQPRQPGCRDLFQGRLCQNHIEIQDLCFNIKHYKRPPAERGTKVSRSNHCWEFAKLKLVFY